MSRHAEDKLMTLSEAVEMISNGDTLGLGGFTATRTQSAIAHEIIRQGRRDLTVVSTSASLQMDIMVGAGCVRRVEHGAASVERFGLTYNFRRAVEQGTVEVEDYTHLAMASRFLAGEMGLPFMPVRGLTGTDIENYRVSEAKMAVMDDPFNPGSPPVAVVPALNPDVAIVHVQKADAAGNLLIEGCLFHEMQLIRSAHKVIVTCEELVPTSTFLTDPERTTIPFLYVDAVVHQPWGAYPSCCYGYYDYDRDHIAEYQRAARDPGVFSEYLKRNVYDTDFAGFLEKNLTSARADELRSSMQSMIYRG